MADSIDFKNEYFEPDYMKPLAGEEINVLWGRKMASNIGHVFYAMPPMLSIIMSDPYAASTPGYEHRMVFHKPSSVNKYRTYLNYNSLSNTANGLKLSIDGTTIFDFTLSSGRNSATYSIDIGQSNVDEMLSANFYVTENDGGVGILDLSIQVYPDWDNI